MLRDEIAKNIDPLLDIPSWSTALDVADAILSLPSGLVAVRECICGDGEIHIPGRYVDGRGICPTCHGTGRIVRDLTLAEVVEWAKVMARLGNGWPKTEACDGMYLESGERIMRREDL